MGGGRGGTFAPVSVAPAVLSQQNEESIILGALNGIYLVSPV